MTGSPPSREPQTEQKGVWDSLRRTVRGLRSAHGAFLILLPFISAFDKMQRKAQSPQNPDFSRGVCFSVLE